MPFNDDRRKIDRENRNNFVESFCLIYFVQRYYIEDCWGNDRYLQFRADFIIYGAYYSVENEFLIFSATCRAFIRVFWSQYISRILLKIVLLLGR